MLFARLRTYKKISLFIIFVILLVSGAFFIGYFWNNDKIGNYGNSEVGIEIKQLRTQEEIAASYSENIQRVVDRLNDAESREKIMAISENSFFDIYVPTDLRDTHLQSMLESRRLSDDNNLDTEQLKVKNISIFQNLLIANQEIINRLE